jgi:hypothetical protein
MVALAALGVVLLPPAAAVATVGLVRWRRGRGAPAGRAWSRSLAEVGMVAGTAPWLPLVMWPTDPPPGTVRVRLVPLTDLAAQLSGTPANAVVQIGGNLLVFAALGLLAPLRFRLLAGGWRLLGLGAAASLAVEASQWVFATGRVFSVDDVLLNGLGCALAGLLGRRWWPDRRVT